MTTMLEPTAQRVVRVWFGKHTIAEIKAEPRLAGRYEKAWQRRFPSLRVTNQPIAPSPDTSR